MKLALLSASVASVAAFGGQEAPPDGKGKRVTEVTEVTIQSLCVETLQASDCTASTFRSVTGACNNVNSDSTQGAGRTPFHRKIRLGSQKEIDEVTELGLEDGSIPSARHVSNFQQDRGEPQNPTLSSWAWQFGQFVDHDLSAIGETAEVLWNIEIPEDDEFFTTEVMEDAVETMKKNKGKAKGRFAEKRTKNGPARTIFSRLHDVTEEGEIEFDRTIFNCPFVNAKGEEVEGDPINFITSLLDAGNVYSSDEGVAADIRANENGLLKTGPCNLLPIDNSTVSLEDESGPFILAGDGRANEQTGLTAIHTLWVREHNRRAGLVLEARGQSPCVDECDEEVFQEARRLTVGSWQKILYEEWLPTILGPNNVNFKAYAYDGSLQLQVAPIFATAAFRFGHTLVNNQLLRLDENFEELPIGPLSLVDAFFRAEHLQCDAEGETGGVEAIMRGMITQHSEGSDMFLADAIRNSLFARTDDLAARNIQRAREHGMANYLRARDFLGFETPTDFSALNFEADQKELLNELYGGVVANVDLFPGALAEEHLEGGHLGETFTAILLDQFNILRNGDRFFYEADPELVKALADVNMRKVISDNAGIPLEAIQTNPFLAPVK